MDTAADGAEGPAVDVVPDAEMTGGAHSTPLIDALPYAPYEKAHYEQLGVREAVRDTRPMAYINIGCYGQCL